MSGGVVRCVGVNIIEQSKVGPDVDRVVMLC